MLRTSASLELQCVTIVTLDSVKIFELSVSIATWIHWYWDPLIVQVGGSTRDRNTGPIGTWIHWYLDPLIVQVSTIGSVIHLESSVCHHRRCQNITQQARRCGLSSTRIHWCAVISRAQCAPSFTDKDCMIRAAGWKALWGILNVTLFWAPMLMIGLLRLYIRNFSVSVPARDTLTLHS